MPIHVQGLFLSIIKRQQPVSPRQIRAILKKVYNRTASDSAVHSMMSRLLRESKVMRLANAKYCTNDYYRMFHKKYEDQEIDPCIEAFQLMSWDQAVSEIIALKQRVATLEQLPFSAPIDDDPFS